MTSVVFETDTILPPEAFIVHGLSHKPNTNSPIGMFGTGLKYAIAVLLREKQRVRFLIDGVEYEFEVRSDKFRGELEYNYVGLKKRRGLLSRWSYQRLPFTLNYGKFWKMWQVYRELESNTRDENGRTYTTEEEVPPVPGKTLIVIEGESFLSAYENRDSVFLPGGVREAGGAAAQAVVSGPTKSVYYRGLKVYELPKPALFSWNILSALALTEDRTLAHPFMVDYYVKEHVLTSKDKALIRTVLNADSNHWESGLDWSTMTTKPSDEFRTESYRSRSSSAAIYSGRFEPVNRVPERPWQLRLADALRSDETVRDKRILSEIRTCSSSLIELLERDVTPKAPLVQDSVLDEDDTESIPF